MTFFSRSFCVLFSVVLKQRPEELSTHTHDQVAAFTVSGWLIYRYNALMVVFNQF